MRDTHKLLMVVAQHDFRDEEYEIPKEIFARSHLGIQTASERRGEAFGKHGARIWVDIPFPEVNVHNYDGVIFIGGPGASHYFHDVEALNLVRDFEREGKLIAAICIAPSILANAGILKGKKVTAFLSEKENLEDKGAIYTGKPVEVDGNIVTANGPAAADDFGDKIVEVLG